MEINRVALDLVLQKIQPNKVIVLLGARRVGKTELIKKLIEKVTEKVLFLNGDDIESHNLAIQRTN